MIQIAPDTRLALLVVAVAFLVAGLILLNAYFSGAGSHRAPKPRKPHRTDPAPPRPGRVQTALLYGELPGGADYPTQPFTVHDTREMELP